MKLVVIGGVAGGASVAARVRRLDENAEIVIFEKDENVSYSNCALPYYLSGMVENSEDLIMMFPEDFKVTHNIDVHTKSEVTSIDRKAKSVTVKDLTTGEVHEESYDKLVIATGAKPTIPKSIKIEGNNNIFTVRNVSDVRNIKSAVEEKNLEKIAVIGGGFIGIEVAENLRKIGKKVIVIEAMSQIMAPYDYDMVQILHKELDDNGVDLILSAAVSEISANSVKAVKDGNEINIEADAVIMAIGVTPETGLAEAAGLEIGETRAIKVNHNYQTSDPDIYAVGDVTEKYNRLTHSVGRLALAGPAQRHARAAADHMYGINHNNTGYIGSSCIRVFGLNAASTGLSERAAKAAGYNCNHVTIFPNDKVGIMPEAHYLAFKLIFEEPTGRILGAQAIGQGEADKRIDVIAAMITQNGTLEDLKELELCYAPLFSTAKDAVNMAALVGLNVLYGKFRQVSVDKARELVENDEFIIDARSPEEYEEGHLKGSHNIPLQQIRERLDEIPRDRTVYIHCRSSQRSYYATCCLQGLGYTNIVNISGSFLGISLYEYFNDKTLNREPVVTSYNFE